MTLMWFYVTASIAFSFGTVLGAYWATRRIEHGNGYQHQ